MPKQEPPYTRLIDSRRQPEETREDIKGTVIGFFTPELFHGIGSASIFTLLMTIATLVVMY